MRARSGAFSLSSLAKVFDDGGADLRVKIVTLYALLLGATVVAWTCALVAFAGRPLLLGTALLAYTFGLRHAVDADHISAIDNVTRKLMQEDKRPVAVGFFFSLGHSTVVIALTCAIALAATAVERTLPGLQNVGGTVGTSVSALFLFAIAAINITVFLEVYSAFRRVRRGEPYTEQCLADTMARAGLMGRLFSPMLRVVGRSRNMYPIGLLFGLGFDTATEVGLLGIAAVEAGKGLPIYDILIFPFLFTVGMSLLDTTDGILMLGAYGWAFVKPVRKLYYNLNITLVSIVVALAVGSVEAASVLSGQLNLKGAPWDQVGRLSDNFTLLGFSIVGVFLASWGVSTWIYRARRYDEIEIASARAD